MPLLTPPIITKLPCISEEISLCKLVDKLDNYDMRRLMDAGWVIISSWIDSVSRIPSQIGTVCVYGVSFRMGRGNERMIVLADISVDVPSGVVLNVDADMPGSKVALIPSSTNESWLLRLCSAAGFGPGSGGGMGTIPAATAPPFFIVGLDIEVSTFARKGNMPLPHDDLISITISNGAWFNDEVPDLCYCIYTFGFHRETKLDNGRKPVFVKAGSSANAVVKTFEILNMLSPDFVNIHNGFGFDLQWLATHSAMVNGINSTFEDRRLGNTGEAVYWRLPNGVSFVDSMYDVDKYQRKDWNSIGLAYLASRMDLPSKLDADEMMIENSDSYDVTDMLIYNARDSDLHALLAKKMRMCERYFALAGTSRSPIWDAIGGNTGYMVHCLEMSRAMSMNMCLDLSRSSDADEKEFEGGFVLEPKPGCYKGVIVIDGNSLYGSIMSKIGVFIDSCYSSSSPSGLAAKLDRDVDHVLAGMVEDDVVEHEDLVLMRTASDFMCVRRSKDSMLSSLLDMLIIGRKRAKAKGDDVAAWSNKLLTVSVYGVMGSRHGAISSKTCAAIVTYLARYYVKLMIRSAEWCGFEVIYGDTDSIFVWVGLRSELACETAGMKVKRAIEEATRGTVFAEVGADIKGNYSSIVISAKKKYEAVNWDGSLETKGLAIVKKDALPIVKYALKEVMFVLNGSFSETDKTERLIKIVSGIMRALQNGKLPVSAQVAEVKINAQPHITYVDNNLKKRSILIGIGVKASDVSKKWVARRIASAIDSVIVPVGLGTVSQLLFIYESRRSMNRGRK